MTAQHLGPDSTLARETFPGQYSESRMPRAGLVCTNFFSSPKFTAKGFRRISARNQIGSKSECVNIFDGKVYQLAVEQTAQLDKVIPRTYAHVLYLYTKHPEAKSLAPEGASCTCGTRGLLQRCCVVAASRRYVGKETDRRRDHGEDLSLVEFTSFAYQQSKQVVAGENIKQDILKTGIRKLERATEVSHHTLDRVLRGESVRRKTLAKIVKQIQLYRETEKVQPGQ
jgi:hypothetical protein